MRVLVVEKHDGEGRFPEFRKGTVVRDLSPCAHYAHWFACAIDCYQTYLPDVYLDGEKLNRAYNPTELIAVPGETVELLDILYEWLYVENQNGETGWLPAAKAVSI